MNGKSQFYNFSNPFGQIFIGSFMFIFKILLLSLMAAMFVNKYKTAYKNLDSYKRFSIIRMKNSSRYDAHLGAISLTFFPINILIAPFILPIIFIKSKRISDFFLKFQYTMMMVMYAFAAGLFIVLLTPLLFIKVVANSFYILLYNKRQKFKGENIIQFGFACFLSPFIIPISITVDFLSMPNTLFKENTTFEHKY
jgi:hypothetical protein